MKNTMGVIKGIGAGMATGIIAGFVGSQMIKNDKQMKKRAIKALNTVGNIIDNVQYMIR